MFCRRFHMWRTFFIRIVNAIVARDHYIMQTIDALGCESPSLLKCTSALQQLAYDTIVDMFDEYIHVSENTRQECLACQAVIEAFKIHIWESQWLMTPRCWWTRTTRILWQHECTESGRVVLRHGEVHMLVGTRAHIRWSCWRLLPTNDCGSSMLTLILLFRITTSMCWTYLHCPTTNVQFIANGTPYNMWYYLAYGRYPWWPMFMNTITCPTTPKRALFIQKQEAETWYVHSESSFTVVYSERDGLFVASSNDLQHHGCMYHNA